MRALFILTGFITILLIFWTILGYIMDMASFEILFPLCLVSIALLVLVGILKTRHDRKKFEEFLESHKRNQRQNEESGEEVSVPGQKPIRSKIRARYRPGKVGLNWTGGSVHGAVPKRKDRREFLDRLR